MRGLVAAALLALGCSGGEGEAVGDRGTPTDSPAAARGDTVAAGPQAADPRKPGDGGVPDIAILDPDRATEPRTYRLILINPRPFRAVVHADAGAARVLLDTVPRHDSVRVDVRVRAVRLRLTATDRFGERLGAASLELVPDSLNRWEVPLGSGGRDSEGGAPPG